MPQTGSVCVSMGLIFLCVLAPARAAAQAPAELPFDRTEDVETCGHYSAQKMAFFGSTHLHTGMSTPAKAYEFAKGQSDPALDWGAVTEHVESEGTPWQEMQEAANEAYNPCVFSSFVAYEATSPSTDAGHRNVIFRNANVIDRPVTASDPDPEKLWDALDDQCLNMSGVLDPDGGQCDVFTIPHGSNLDGGAAFFDPPTPDFSQKRQKWEPLVEIYQSKGSSECRWDPRLQEGVQTADEHCAFELLDASAGAAVNRTPETSLEPYPARSWVRNILKDGLVYLTNRKHRVNPFTYGILASSDNHHGTMGWHPEDAQARGHAGMSDAVPTRSVALQHSSGGYSVVWAEENTRDAIFTALRNKETYGTSGTRITVRFFGGWDFSDDICNGDYAWEGYASGVPMGGDLPKIKGAKRPPRFVASAWMDDWVRTPLQQIQIIKGWADADGLTHEVVHTVAGGDNDAWVDRTCNPTGAGAADFCKVWEDPDFDPDVPAFYYARVLENPVCRFSTRLCQEEYDVNPLDTDCENQLKALSISDASAAADAAFCCSNETTGPIVQPIIQERAWTSPIWYTPNKMK